MGGFIGFMFTWALVTGHLPCSVFALSAAYCLAGNFSCWFDCASVVTNLNNFSPQVLPFLSSPSTRALVAVVFVSFWTVRIQGSHLEKRAFGRMLVICDLHFDMTSLFKGQLLSMRTSRDLRQAYTPRYMPRHTRLSTG